MFETWIRLILNKYELYIYRILDKYFIPDQGIFSDNKLYLILIKYNLKKKC